MRRLVSNLAAYYIKGLLGDCQRICFAVSLTIKGTLNKLPNGHLSISWLRCRGNIKKPEQLEIINLSTIIFGDHFFCLLYQHPVTYK